MSLLELLFAFSASSVAEMHEFVSYFEKTRVGSSATESILTGFHHSNNLVDGWYNGFQTLAGTSNPTF